MHLPKLAIENHQFTMVLIILLVLFGIVSFLTMPRSEDPQVSPPGSTVAVIYPGATPADMEELVIEPIEEVINELEDIIKLTSSAEDGLAVIAVEFITGSNPDDKYSDVVQKVNSIRNSLPNDILSLDITKWSITDVNILQLALFSDSASYNSLENEVKGIKDLLFFDYPRCKHTRYFAEKLTLRVTTNPQNKNFLETPGQAPRNSFD